MIWYVCVGRACNYFIRWQYGLFGLNKFIQTCAQCSVGVEIQLFKFYTKILSKDMKEIKMVAFIGYVNDLNKLQMYIISVQKSHH